MSDESTEFKAGAQKLPIELRKARKSDVPFLMNSWLTSFRDGKMVGGVPNRIYYYNHHKILEQVIPRSAVMVAVDQRDPDLIVGWACYEVTDGALVMHYVYVKKRFRGWGVASNLVNTILEIESPPVVMYTHINREGMDFLRAKDIWWIHNPYLLFMDLPKGWTDEIMPVSNVSKLDSRTDNPNDTDERQDG
jgi:GNAT superfamily N-acetyltransferase